MSTRVFLTGATGFIGSGLLQKWLAEEPDAEIALLARSRKGSSPGERIERVLAELYPETDIKPLLDRLRIVQGDISRPQFGLAAAEYKHLAQRTTHIIHCAAAVRFDLPAEEARGINVAGARHVLDLARDCRALARLDYVGTAYVAGTRRGTILEDDLNLGQDFNNTYEQTKMESEQLMRQAMDGLPISVHRPSIVVGDSRTGRTSRYSAIHRMLVMYHRGMLPALPGYASTLLDIVPLDYVADTIHSISKSRAGVGRCFHITAGTQSLTSLGEICELAHRHFDLPRFAIVPPEAFEAAVSKTEGELSGDQRDLLEEIRIYKPYLVGQVRFDDSGTRALLGPSHPGVPRLATYFGKMARYVVSAADRAPRAT
jgi:thioester reductase-like protein